MLDNVSEEIRHCHLKAEECRQRAKTAFDAEAIARFLAMEQNWLDLAHSYENTERLARFASEVRSMRSPLLSRRNE